MMVSFVGGAGVGVEVLVIATTRLGIGMLEVVVMVSHAFGFWALEFLGQFLAMCP